MSTITIETEFLSPDTLVKMYRDIADLKTKRIIVEILTTLVGREDAWKMIREEMDNR